MRTTMLSIGIIIAGVLGAQPVLAQPPASVRVVNRAQVLSRPSTDGNVVTLLEAGTILQVLDSDGQWYWVALPSDAQGGRVRGWVRAADVQILVASLPPSPADLQAAKAQREKEQRQRELEQQRTEKARREVERRQAEYDAAVAQALQKKAALAEPAQPASAPEPPARPVDHRPVFTPAPRRREPIGIRAFGEVDTDALLAHQSFDAVLGTSRLTAFGGGADVLNVWKTLFVRVAVSRASKGGTRAFVTGGQVVSLGIPITVTIMPVEIGGGWRFLSSRSSRVVPYAGGGMLIQSYSEKSTFAGPGDNVSQTNTGYTAFGGVEVGLSKWFIVGGEAQYRGVPNAIGKGSVSQDFGETNLGGFSARVLFGVKH